MAGTESIMQSCTYYGNLDRRVSHCQLPLDCCFRFSKKKFNNTKLTSLYECFNSIKLIY